MTLYTVDIGDYSDRRTIAIVDEIQKANIEADGMLDGYTEAYKVRFTPFKLNDVMYCPAGYKPYQVIMYIDTGDVQYVDEACYYELLDPVEYHTEFETDLDFSRCVAARDEEHAVKIVNEMRTTWKAMNNWQPPVYD